MKKLKLILVDSNDKPETILNKQVDIEHKNDITSNNELTSTERKGNICNITSTQTEQNVIDILKKFDCVKDVWKDRYNSKFDIYYILNGEDVIRGLQIKSIVPVKSINDRYIIQHLHKYEDGMLMVCLNKMVGIGITYIDSFYYRVTSTFIAINRNPINKFEKLILPWDQFTLKLKDMLYHGIVVTL